MTKRERVFQTDPAGAAEVVEREAPREPGTLEVMTFSMHILSLNVLGQMHLGLIEGPGGLPAGAESEARLDLDAARHVIDTLQMLKEKTQGNLDPEESRLLDSILYELRLGYVEKR